MRAYCNKAEDNFITYHSIREKIINNVREWEQLNPEKRKEYTIKYYKTEKGHRKRLAQQKRYREKRKLIKENEKLKNDKMELLKKVDILQQENQQLKDKIKQYEDPEDMTLMFMWCEDKAKDKIKELEHNWNELKKWLKEEEKEYRKDVYPGEYGLIIGTMLRVLNKMQELEEASNE